MRIGVGVVVRLGREKVRVCIGFDGGRFFGYFY